MSQVLFAPVGLSVVDAKHTLTARYDAMLRKTITREMVEKKSVAIKIHIGGRETYTTNHPTFLRRVALRVIECGGKPFITDSSGTFNLGAGYAHEVLGCPVYPAAGLNNKYAYTKKTGSKLLPTVEIAGFIHDADVLINLSHAKGHGCASYGGAIKNLGMGAVTSATRRAVHTVTKGAFKLDAKLCGHCGVCIEHCRGHALKFNDKKELVVFDHNCIYCGRCTALCHKKAITMDESLWPKFQHALSLAAREAIRTFEPERVLHINVILAVTALCDCFGMGLPSIVPDVGIVMSNDIVSIEKATLDLIGQQPFFADALPGGRKPASDEGHPFFRCWAKDPYEQVTAAAKLKMGEMEYKIKKVV